MKKFIFNSLGMICASADAESRTYDMAIGKSGRRWLHNGTADNIYCEGEKDSKGFGGRWLEFALTDGTKLKLKGPWHSGPKSLFEDTGVDLRAMYKTFKVVARKMEQIDGETMMTDVVWRDAEPAYGLFQRGENKAQELADQLGEKLYYCTRTSDGAHMHFKIPIGTREVT